MQAGLAIDTDFASSIDLARRLHDTIAQRLTGLSCFLGEADQPVSDDALERCRDEIHAAIDELREALDSVGRERPVHDRAVEAAVSALRSDFPDVQLEWRCSRDPDVDDASLVDSFLVEALCNVRKHARPTRVVVETELLSGATILSVANDGVHAYPGSGTRLGSRLLALEATARGAITDSCSEGAGLWRQRLILPVRSLCLSA